MTKKTDSVRIGDSNGTDKDRMGVVYLEKSFKHKRNPRRQKKLNENRTKLTEEDKKNMKFADFVGLNTTWQKYYRQQLGNNFNAKKHDKRILKADYHGAVLTVWGAENPTQIGISGIVVLETRYTFQLVTIQDRFVVIPKKGTTFRFILGDRLFTLFADGMRQRPALRGKKPRIKRVLPMFIRGTLIPPEKCAPLAETAPQAISEV
ncbi:unnamed protein product [Caenorhabditis auriculariae]|uniref:Ribonuclease P protein subunit p29 n=1 Tax=Caenorhabditis auriculariae TaxID=2777116 RepID=A0A8S1HQV3_9PELO|nr:unnamed protein product [Caenorhabditis auriculariae]